VGSLRHGLNGASESLADARLALRATGPDRTVAYFGEDWLESVLLAQGERIRPVVGSGIEVARQHPHLAQTVLAFADADMSIAAAAHRLQLHANSVTYRLERWESLTGISARTFRGLSAAVMACRLAQSDG
jgi:DNA-binding PucR family transcriptional regulator